MIKKRGEERVERKCKGVSMTPENSVHSRSIGTYPMVGEPTNSNPKIRESLVVLNVLIVQTIRIR